MTRTRLTENPTTAGGTADRDYLIRQKILRTIVADILRSDRKRLNIWLFFAAKLEQQGTETEQAV